MIKKLTSVSITNKIYLPLIFIILFGLSIVALNSYVSLESIEKKAKEDITKELQSYITQELNKKFQVSLTNAISISINQNIIKALQNNDRELAEEVVSDLINNFKKYTKHKNIQIHIHDKDLKSFLRSWNYKAHGDDLGSFRYALKYVHDNKLPILATENGRIGMQIRGIAPIFDKKQFIGTIEVMQDFNPLVLNAKKNKNYSVIVFNCEQDFKSIKKFAQEKRLGSRAMILSQNYEITDKVLYKSLEKEYDQEKMTQNGLVKIGNYYVTSIEMQNLKDQKIGCILIAANKEYVNRYVDQAKETYFKLIWILLIVDILILITLVYLLNTIVKQPISNLQKSLIDINQKIKNGATPVEVYKNNKLTYMFHDEMGVISVTINTLLRTMAQTFKKLQQSQKHTSEYIKAIYAGGLVSTSDINGDITYINEEFCKVTGYTAKELIGKPHNIFRDPKTPKSTYTKLWETIKAGKIYNDILKNVRKDGSTFYTNTTIIPIKNDKDEIVEYIAFRDDITELVNSKKELRKTFLTDSLTNLGNRFKMLSDISTNCYLAILDIQSFKEINDFYGYKTGDKVLKNLASRLFSYFDARGMEVYHLNGDEFAIISNRDTITQSGFFELVKEFLEQTKKGEFSLDDNISIIVQLTCGISYDGDNLVNYADVAHQHAKKTNKDLVEYTNDINTDQEYEKKLAWTKEIREAISDNRIEAYYQPIVNYETSKIEKYETLMRLIKKDGEVVSPFHFLDIAKKTRVYKELTKIVVTKAFDKFANTEYDFSINLSIEDIMFHDIESWIFDLAVAKGVNEKLVIELVESEGIESFEMIDKFIQKAKEYKMKIAIDDFGTGYSNFEYLIKLNADFIKIDGSLIRDIDTNEKLCGVVETIITFAKRNDIKVIGEFVSSKGVYEKTKDMGIDYGQGYYLGIPMSELQ